MSRYMGYRFESDGRYHSGDLLYEANEMFQYLKEHMQVYPFVKIANSDDHFIAEAKDGHIVFPKYLAIIHIREKMRQKEVFDAVDFMECLRGSEIYLSISVPRNAEEAETILNRLYTHYMDNLIKHNSE